MVSGLGNVYVDGQLISTNKGDQELWIESKDIELNTRGHKYIDTFNAEMKNSGSSTAKIKLGWRDRLEDPIKWTDWFPLSDLDNLCWTRITGRFSASGLRMLARKLFGNYLPWSSSGSK